MPGHWRGLHNRQFCLIFFKNLKKKDFVEVNKTVGKKILSRGDPRAPSRPHKIQIRALSKIVFFASVRRDTETPDSRQHIRQSRTQTRTRTRTRTAPNRTEPNRTEPNRTRPDRTLAPLRKAPFNFGTRGKRGERAVNNRAEVYRSVTSNQPNQQTPNPKILKKDQTRAHTRNSPP